MKNIQELEEHLSNPSADLMKELDGLEGDILILGAGGKMGPSLAKLAKRAAPGKRIVAVSRFSDQSLRSDLERFGVETIPGDLMENDFIHGLPDIRNVIYMAGQKFGTIGNEHYTWAMNSYLPGRVSEKFKNSRIVAFSTGNVYPFMPVEGTGATESTPVVPVGEYAQSCLGRERIFQFFSLRFKTPILIFRLNYALDLRYGVLNDVARAVWSGLPIDLTTGHVNVIWQGDANEYALRCFRYCESPPKFLNITGPEIVSVKWLAEQFGELLDREPVFRNVPAATALLNDSSLLRNLMGPPRVSLKEMIRWTAEWVQSGGEQLNKPTHFQERSGSF